MKIKDNLVLRKVGKDYVIVDPNQGQVDLSRVFSFNESAAFLIESLGGKEFDLETASTILQNEYGIEPERAINDCRAILVQLKEQHLLSD